MKIEATTLPEVKCVTLDVFADNRGCFSERYHAQRFAEHGITENFVQDNWSHSKPGVIRGLHFQHTPMQGKLVGCTRGRVLDIAVDIRPTSPNFCKHVAVELSQENATLLWIPAGFAHGFCVLGDEPADVVYKLTAHYNASGEQGVAYNDPAFDIDWPIKNPIISARDQAQPTLAELTPDLKRWFA
jgi:dTDP-4-dehydrorhamnose 3,5-epimerase